MKLKARKSSVLLSEFGWLENFGVQARAKAASVLRPVRYTKYRNPTLLQIQNEQEGHVSGTFGLQPSASSFGRHWHVALFGVYICMYVQKFDISSTRTRPIEFNECLRIWYIESANLSHRYHKIQRAVQKVFEKTPTHLRGAFLYSSFHNSSRSQATQAKAVS